MRISKEKLSSEAEGTGFRAEVLEKVIHLLNLLETLHKHPILCLGTGVLRLSP